MRNIEEILKQARAETIDDLAKEGIGYHSDRTEGPRGIRIPNSTQIPNEILDFFMASLSEAELKVLLYIVRKTFGYNKVTGDQISLSQLENGTKRKSGEVLDKGTGLARKTIISALKTLEKVGFVEITKRNSKGSKSTNHYRLCIEQLKG